MRISRQISEKCEVSTSKQKAHLQMIEKGILHHDANCPDDAYCATKFTFNVVVETIYIERRITYERLHDIVILSNELIHFNCRQST